jgi:hypothetical protein
MVSGVLGQGCVCVWSVGPRICQHPACLHAALLQLSKAGTVLVEVLLHGHNKNLHLTEPAG